MTYEESIVRYAGVMDIPLKEAKEMAEKTIALYISKGDSPDFAQATWIEDCEDLDGAELDEMAQKAKKNKSTLVHAKNEDKMGAKRTRTPKEDTEKRKIIAGIARLMENLGFSAVKVPNIQQEITFLGENDAEFSIKLTKHRAKKA